ncbi:glycosyltransferase [Paenarthrobacter nicotinovorans]|uniref:glycosyltransferase n=1 Tax=Paenarthrobacter nicotinovorans TaxID=29320 RepID=UPI001E4FF2D4|nr:glycosyltransferase [Paenarthrobacter nicotinovorans]
MLITARDRVINPVGELDTASIFDQGKQAVIRHTLLRDRRPLKRILEMHNIEVVHAHFGVEGMYSLPAARSLSLPHFTTLHGFDVSTSRAALLRSKRPAWMYYSMLRQKFLRSESQFICVSRHIQQLAVELGAEPERTVVIGTGVDTERIQASEVPDTPVILHVARLVEKKGTAYLIRAFAALVKVIPEARLRIIGSGPLEAHLKSQVAGLDLTRHVDFLGVQPHKRVLQELQKARVLCLPSVTAASGDQEGLGQVLLEAGAMGRPVVATNHGGIADAIVHDRTGLLVGERDILALADALTIILEDQSLAQRLGAAARAYVEQDFNVFLQAEKVEALYRSALV